MYDALGRRTSMMHANGVETTYSYDAASQLLSLVHELSTPTTTINSFTYTYDKVGNRKTKADNNGTANYTYDTLNRLINATNPLPSNPLESFTYDEVGNRTDSNQNGLSTFNAANQLEGDADFTYSYDNNGNLIQKTDKTTSAFTLYEYDAENRLIRVVRDDGSIVNYKYDGLGRRIEKEVDTVVSKYIYDYEDILLEIDASNNIVARYTHGPGIDEPLNMEKSGESFFYHTDALGSITELTDIAGAVSQSYAYSSFGKIESQLDLNFIQPYTFTAREFDLETGLYYYRARIYDASTGRFLQEDPIGFAGGINVYVYGDSNPVNWIDPWGLAGNDEWQFHEYDHGGPHLQRGQDRYRYSPETKHLEPIPHKGRTPPALSKNQLRNILKSKAWKKMVRRLGVLGVALTAMEIFDAANANRTEAFDNLLDLINDFPEETRRQILEQVCKGNADLCSKNLDQQSSAEGPTCK